MFEIVFLGTSAAAPSIYRGLSSSVVIAGEHRYLVDCGEGTQRQILRSGVGFRKLNRILLTHAHLDHILGLGGLISTFARWESVDYLEIWGGRPALARVYTLIYEVVLRNEKTPMPLHLIDLKPGKIYDAKDYTVSAFPVSHRGKGNFGFIFEEKARRPFLAQKAEELNVPAGPERSQLVQGETITLADGRTITPDMVLGEAIKGCKFVYVGDTGDAEKLRPYVNDADTLVIEATFLESEAEEAQRFGHLTARQAGELAQAAGVKSLLINHVSRRYAEGDIIREAQAAFPGAYVVRDLDHFVIRRGDTALKSES